MKQPFYIKKKNSSKEKLFKMGKENSMQYNLYKPYLFK